VEETSVPLSGEGAEARCLIVIPLHNEADSIAAVLRGLREVSTADVLVVDDGSVDGSAAAVQASGVCLPHLIRHRRNLGYGVALRSGFEFALRQGYDVVMTFDADGQHDPGDVPRLLEASPHADIISGSRFHPDSPRVGTPPPERLEANQRLTRLVRQYTGYAITDSACGFKLYHAGALAQLCITEAGYAMPYQVWGQAARAGLTVYEVPVTMIYKPSDDAQSLEPAALEETVRGCQRILLQALTESRLRRLVRRWYLHLIRRE